MKLRIRNVLLASVFLAPAIPTETEASLRPTLPISDGSTAQRTLDRLTALVDSWVSLDFQVEHHLLDPTRSGPNGSPPYRTQIDQHYIATAAGQRYLQLISRDPGKQDHIYTSYCDGEKCYNITQAGSTDAPQKQYLIKRDFSDEDRSLTSAIPPPFRYLYLEQQPLGVKLNIAQLTGEDRIIGRDCDVFTLSGVRWTQNPVLLVYVIDRETGWPLRVTCFGSEADQAADRAIWDWEVEEIELAGTHTAPVASRELLHIRSLNADDGKPPREVVREIKVTSCEFDKGFAPEFFHPVIQPGASVWDQIEEKNWVEPGAVGTDESGSSGSADTASSAIAPPRTWGQLLLKYGLTTGLIIFLLSIFTWLRTRN